MTGFTCKYNGAQQELLTSILNSSIITHEYCFSRVTQAQHTSYLQNFVRHEASHMFFDVSCTITKNK